MMICPKRKIKIAPSMMCADVLRLGDELSLFAAHDVDWLHIDVMDGHYVPNFALSIDYCLALHAASRIPLDVHLMIEQPDRHVASFCAIPCTRVTFHPETVRQPIRLIERIRESAASPGIALDPSQTVEQFRHLIPLVDQVLIMTVNPGLAGQKVIPHCLHKIGETREFLLREELTIDLEVDGNVSWQNIPLMVKEGATVLVAGTSSLFEKTRSRREAFQEWQVLLERLEKSGLANTH
jgi:ribulose-phosphate 3-epimerase